MIRNLLAVIGFLCVAMAGTAAVYATRWYGSDDQPQRLAVSVRGLDLTSSEGQRLLDRRIDLAIDRVCAPSSRSFGYDGGDRDCRRRARAGADPQIARAIDRAFEQRRFVDDDTPIAPEGYDPTPVAPEPRYAGSPHVEWPRASDSTSTQVSPPVLREKHVSITRTALKPRVKWVRTRHGLVKKVVRRERVRKTVRMVYVR